MYHAQDFVITLTVKNDELHQIITGQATGYQQAQVLVQAAVTTLIKAGYNPEEAVRKIDQMAAISTLSEEDMMDSYWADDSEPGDDMDPKP